MEKKLVNIKDVINTNLKGQISVKSINNLKIWLDSDEKIRMFERYVIGMGNGKDLLNLDVLAYRQLVLDNRQMDLESVKRQLKCNKFDKRMWRMLNNLFLEDLSLNEAKEALRIINMDNNFLDFWNDRKGIPFSKLLYMYDILIRWGA